jgi:hypothetical protein
MMERYSGMDDWEWVAGWVLERSQGDAWQIAAGLGIEVQRVLGMLTIGALARYDGRTIIGVRKSLPKPYAAFAIAHEIGHWALRQVGSEDSEAGADYIAGALLMPRSAFLGRVRDVGANPEQLALPFGVTQTAAMLRLGEVHRQPLALIAPHTVRVRGPESWTWPDENTLRGWGRRGGPGLAKVRLSDDTRRVALLASGDDD